MRNGFKSTSIILFEAKRINKQRNNENEMKLFSLCNYLTINNFITITPDRTKEDLFMHLCINPLSKGKMKCIYSKAIHV